MKESLDIIFKLISAIECRKNSTKGGKERHTLVKTQVEDFISKITKINIKNISKQFKDVIRKIKVENIRLIEKIDEQYIIIEVLEKKQDKMFKCHYILFYGLKENEEEVYSRNMFNLFTGTIISNINETCIESFYRIGRETKNKNKPILVKDTINKSFIKTKRN